MCNLLSSHGLRIMSYISQLLCSSAITAQAMDNVGVYVFYAGYKATMTMFD